MNDLNSVLLEGKVTADPAPIPNGCTFSILASRLVKTDDGQKTTTSLFPIEVTGRLAEVCQEYLKAGRGVRIVGRLCQDPEDALLFIQAEHVEFKPERSKPETEVTAISKPLPDRWT